MKIFKHPQPCEWADIVERPHMDVSSLGATVSAVLQDVKTRGDEAVKEYEEKFDHARLTDLAVSQDEMDEAERFVSAELRMLWYWRMATLSAFMPHKILSQSRWKRCLVLRAGKRAYP